MKKVNQKVKKYASNVIVVDNNNLQERIVYYLIVVFFGLTLFYVLILLNMVWNIVERKNLEASVHNLSSEVGDLELKYLALSNQVDIPMSTKMGFQEVKPTFATAEKSLGTLVKVSNEI